MSQLFDVTVVVESPYEWDTYTSIESLIHSHLQTLGLREVEVEITRGVEHST